MIVGHQNVGALAALDRCDPDIEVSLLALVTGELGLDPGSLRPRGRPVRSVLAVTETERRSIVSHHGGTGKVHRIGAPLAANPSVLGEPNTWVGETDYFLVLTGVATTPTKRRTSWPGCSGSGFPTTR